MSRQSEVARRGFIKAAAGVAALASIRCLTAQQPRQDAGAAFVLSPEERDTAAALLNEVFTPYLGEWVGTRDSRDTGVQGPILFTKRYSHYLGGPQMVAEVEAIADGVAVFSAAKHYVYSPARNTLLTYFFEGGGTVQIFELDRKKMAERKLHWREILRSGPQFRVEETLPQNSEWSSTVFVQDAAGNEQVFARNVLRRKWREADRRKALNSK